MEKIGNSVICNNTDDLVDMLNEIKSHRKRQILYDITFMWNPKKPKS